MRASGLQYNRNCAALKKDTFEHYIKYDLKNSVFKHFLKDCNDVQLLVPWDKLFQILGALNEKALPTNAFGGMGAFKEMLADDRRALVCL